MADQDELVRAARVLKCLSYSIGATGECMMVFEIDKGDGATDKFAITMPVTGLKAFRSMVSDLIRTADNRGLNTSMAAIHYPSEVEVSNSSHVRGAVLLTFNPKADDEAIFALPNEIGLNVAEAMQKDIFPRMTEAERRSHIAKKSSLLSTSRPALILPPGR